MRPPRRRRLLLWGLVAVMVLLAPIELFIIGRLTGTVRNMYVPSESMEPTLKKGDRFVAWTRASSVISRGDIVLVSPGGGAIFVNRVAATAGDTVAIRDGVVVLNGRPVAQRRIGAARTSDARPVTLLSEQFPGEATPHRIYDEGRTMLDDIPEQRVARGHVFLLGDNRDNSADSRLPREQHGMGQVPVSAMRGRPWFFTWTTDGGKFGRPAGH